MGREDYSVFHLGDFVLSSGAILKNAFLAYQTYGDPKHPALVYPTPFGATIADNAVVVFPENEAFSPEKYFIIIPALIGNGQSISPSNTPSLQLNNFPVVTYFDNVAAQYRLVTEALGVTHVRAVLGWSMAAAQAFQWAVQYPDFMDAIVAYAGSAKTSVHNNVFLEGQKGYLAASRGGWSNGIGKGQTFGRSGPWGDKERSRALKAFGRGYAGWGFSQTFYRQELFKVLGFPDVEAFLGDFWETWASTKEPDNLLVMLQTWQLGDVSQNPTFKGDLRAAMRSIKAKTLILPARTDLYFPPEDSYREVEAMSEGVGKCVVIPSEFGHFAAAPGLYKEDWDFLHGQILAHLKQVEADLRT